MKARSGSSEPRFACVFDDIGTVEIERDGKPCARARAVLDDLPIADAFWSSLSSRLADLGDVAVAVYATDRLCRRPSGDAWHRVLEIELPVRDVDFWSDAHVHDRLTDVLRYVTDDEWRFRFVRKHGYARPSEHPTLFSRQPKQPVVGALFSGGLDSAAGLVRFAIDDPCTSFAIFSARTSTRTGKPQRRQLDLLDIAFRGRLWPTSATFGFAKGDEHHFDREERTQRTRGFAFQALGSIAAHLAGATSLLVFENGIGAINLPYLDSQIGSQCTRATSPITLALTSSVVAAVLGSEFEVRLPHLLRTKAELCQALNEAALQRLVSLTVSCDHFPQRKRDVDHCGACISCILRRQSVFEAGLESYDTVQYAHAALAQGTGPRADGWFAYRAMEIQASRLSEVLAAESTDPHAIERAFPVFGETVPYVLDRCGRGELLALFARYCAEWDRFRAHVMTASIRERN